MEPAPLAFGYRCDGWSVPHAGTYENQRAPVYQPDNPLFAKLRQRVETEQGTSARRPKRKRQAELPLWLQERIAAQDREGAGGITPLESNALGLRYATCGSDPPLRRLARTRRGASRADRSISLAILRPGTRPFSIRKAPFRECAYIEHPAGKLKGFNRVALR